MPELCSPNAKGNQKHDEFLPASLVCTKVFEFCVG
jgi:hypothetical protein